MAPLVPISVPKNQTTMRNHHNTKQVPNKELLCEHIFTNTRHKSYLKITQPVRKIRRQPETEVPVSNLGQPMTITRLIKPNSIVLKVD